MAVAADADGDNLFRNNVMPSGTTGDFAACFWVYHTGAQGNWGGVFNIDVGDAANYFFIGVDTLNRWYMDISGTADQSSSTYVNNAWYGVAIVVNSAPATNEYRMWVWRGSTGAEVAAISINTNNSRGVDLHLLDPDSFTDVWIGRMDGFKSWTTLVSSTSNNNREWLHQELFSYWPVLTTTGLYQVIPMWDSSHDLQDMSGGGNDLTRNGTNGYGAGAPIPHDLWYPNRGHWIGAAAPPAGAGFVPWIQGGLL